MDDRGALLPQLGCRLQRGVDAAALPGVHVVCAAVSRPAQRLVQPGHRRVPHRVMIFISVVGLGRPSAQPDPSELPARGSNRPPHDAATHIRADTGTSDTSTADRSPPRSTTSSASTRVNSTGNANNSAGKIASHSDGCSFTVLSTLASIPSSPRGPGQRLDQPSPSTGPRRPDFQVELLLALTPAG